jgi:hypothetical protein
MKEDYRVLGRLGARELTMEEIEHVAAGRIVHTDNCTGIVGTMTGDGDACSDTDVTAI